MQKEQQKEKLKNWLDALVFLTSTILGVMVFTAGGITSTSDKAAIIFIFFVMFVVTALYFGNKFWKFDYLPDVIKALVYLTLGVGTLIYAFTGIGWILLVWVLVFLFFIN